MTDREKTEERNVDIDKSRMYMAVELTFAPLDWAVYHPGHVPSEFHSSPDCLSVAAGLSANRKNRNILARLATSASVTSFGLKYNFKLLGSIKRKRLLQSRIHCLSFNFHLV